MTMFSGAKHDVEDILASIRTSIADRSPGYEMERREAHVTTLRGRSIVADEAMEFELPAIFKNHHRHNPLRNGPIFSGASAKFCRQTGSKTGTARAP